MSKEFDSIKQMIRNLKIEVQNILKQVIVNIEVQNILKQEIVNTVNRNATHIRLNKLEIQLNKIEKIVE